MKAEGFFVRQRGNQKVVGFEWTNEQGDFQTIQFGYSKEWGMSPHEAQQILSELCKKLNNPTTNKE